MLTSSEIGDAWDREVFVELLDLAGDSLICDTREMVAQIAWWRKLKVVHTFDHVDDLLFSDRVATR